MLTFQITIPHDFYQWLETLDAEFEERLGRLIRGPMWSGLPPSDVGDPLKVYIACEMSCMYLSSTL